MTNAISVKDRLKKQVIEDGKTMQEENQSLQRLRNWKVTQGKEN